MMCQDCDHKVRIRLIATEECFEVYRKTKTGEESQGLYLTQKEAYKVANKLNGGKKK